MSGSLNIRQVHQKRKLVKMKNNVINSQFVIECFEGSLEIIGESCHNVVFILRGSAACDLIRSAPSFCKNQISSNEAGGDKLLPIRKIFIFEYSLKGGLRNPRKLLKSVRNKLVQACFRNQKEDDKEFDEMYSMTDRQEHEMFR